MKKYILLLATFFLTGALGVFGQNINLKNSSTELHESKLETSPDEVANKNISTATSSAQGLSSTGGLSVSLSGAANYQVPFKLPPGIGESLPSVGLVYSNQSSDGIAGWGWNITGLSAITRTSSTVFHDTFIGPVDFNSDDRYVLNGQRLILKSGVYGKAGSVYETENYSNVKIIAHGTSPFGAQYGPAYFVVHNPDGSRFWYGNNGSHSKLEWSISKTQDTQGNTINYTYTNSNGVLLTNTITYGGQVNQTAPNVIQFFYKDKKRGELAYVGGFGFKNDNILDRVEIKSGGKLYRKYDLVYSYSSLDYERLSSIIEQNGSYVSLPPIKFFYQSTADDLEKINQTFNISPGISAEDDRMVNGDFDGDGKIDILVYKKYRHTTEDKKINVFRKIFSSSNATGRKMAIDDFDDIYTSVLMDANNRIKNNQGILTRKGINFKVFSLGNSANLEYTKTWNDAPRYVSESEEPENLTITRPVNGGSQSKSGIKVNAQNVISNSATVDYSGFDYLLLKPGFHAKRGVNFKGTTNYNSGRAVPMNYLSGDFNGDGITDILAISKPYTYFRNCREEDISDPYEQYDEYETVCDDYRYNYSDTYFINLDRRVTSNFSHESGRLKYPVDRKDRLTTADFDGDGKTDILHYKKGKVYVYKLLKNNTLKLILEKSNPSIDLDYPILPGDYNGDGKSDFVIPTADNSSIWKFFIATGNNYVIFDEDIQVTYSKFSGGGSYYKYKGKNYNYGPTTSPGDRSIFEYNFTPIDFNNDGKTDIIYHKTITPLNSDSHSHQAVGIVANYGMTSSNTINFRFTNYLEADNDGITKYGIPVYTDITSSRKGSEYAFICGSKVQAYDIKKDHRSDVSLNLVNNNGLISSITYEKLDSNTSSGIYSKSTTAQYPYVDIANAPSFMLVKEIGELVPGIPMAKTQRFRYHGAVSNTEGLGFIGFKRVSRTNWTGTDVGTLWTTTVSDPKKRNALIQQWTTESLQTSLPSSGFVNKSLYTYRTELNNRKVFVNIPTRIVTSDGLTGVTTTQTLEHDSYFNTVSTLNSYPGGSNLITVEYANNPSAANENFHIGRPVKKKETATLKSERFSAEKKYIYQNNLVVETKSKANNSSVLTEKFNHDDFGNIIEKVLSGPGIASRKELFKYDVSGRFIIEQTNVEGLVTKHAYDNTNGHLLNTTNPYGQKTAFEYDKWNRLTKETDYLGNTITTKYSSYYGGGTKREVITSSGGGEETYINRLGWKIQGRVRNLMNQWVSTVIEYDLTGKKKRESEPFIGGGASQWTSYTYDRYGREINKKLPTGRVITSTYNKLSRTVDDGVKSVTSTKDVIGNIVKVTDLGGTINYTYHANGEIKQTNYQGYITTIDIDEWGRKIKLSDPSSGTYTYKHNILGELLEETTPKGITTYSYDTFGKTLEKHVKGENTDLKLNYEYDNTSKLVKKVNSTDLINNKSYIYAYEYDSNKRLTSLIETNNDAIYRKNLNYDTKGRTNFEEYISRSLHSGVESKVKIKNHYHSSSGGLYMITDYNSGDLIWKGDAINGRGQFTQMSLGNGLIKTRSYDAYGLPSKFKDFEDKTGGVVALEIDYTFDAQRGNLLNRHNKAFTGKENFTYDSFDRLTSISGAIQHTQSYDTRGRIDVNSNIGKYGYANSSSYNLKEVTLNNQGDAHYLDRALQQISYNSFKKPVDVLEENKGRVTFEYNPSMERSVAYYGGLDEDKEQRTYKKLYSSILPVEIVHNKDDNSTKIITYIAGDAYTAPVAHVKKQGSSSNINSYHYLHRDHLGSIMAITDSNANIVEQTHYGAWGNVEKYTSSSGATNFGYESLLGRGFTGHEHFVSVGLIHMNGRMYDANLGRFLSPDNYVQDPYNSQSYNRYGYVWNNPLSLSDPTGEIVWIAVAIGAIIGAATAAISYAVQAIRTGNWNWGSFALSVLGGALTGAIGGIIAPASVLTAAGNFGLTLIGGVLSSFLPSITIPIGDFSFSLSPSIAFGNAVSLGANFRVGYRDGSFNASVGFGVSYAGSAQGTGDSGWEYRGSYSVGYDDGKFRVSVYSTSFASGETSQRVAGINIGHGDFNLRYENDGSPFDRLNKLGLGKPLVGEDSDRYRTAAMSLSYKDYSVGFNLFTGDPNGDKDKGITKDVPGHGDFTKYKWKGDKLKKIGEFTGGQYSGESASKYRLGAAYVSYKGFRFGRNSEGIRHTIQNKVAHTAISYQPWFKVLDIQPQGYFQYQSPNPYTLW
ncbi:polymorphic toxin type 23 domain-containing protein [Aquimarina aggregata]|uniref:polymorphic toxin type 23 domain-containing protein n=1 Tax=Aquimarina aggregata TaxID=1642818 RepID=UPI0024905714|nr:polymorphic toxin type 23 domain-containing protein [Aquimarina aggregata]